MNNPLFFLENVCSAQTIEIISEKFFHMGEHKIRSRGTKAFFASPNSIYPQYYES